MRGICAPLKNQREVEMSEVKAKKYILNKKVGGSILIPVHNEKGEIELRKDSFGRPVIDKTGKQVICMKRIVVSPMQTNVKGRTCGIIETSDKWEQKYLDEKVKQPESSIITMEKWKKEQNPVAYEMEEKYNKQLEINIQLQKKLEELEKKDIGKKG